MIDCSNSSLADVLKRIAFISFVRCDCRRSAHLMWHSDLYRCPSMFCATFPYEHGCFVGLHVVDDEEEQHHDSEAESRIHCISPFPDRMKSDEEKKNGQRDHGWNQNGSTCSVRCPSQHQDYSNDPGYTGGHMQKNSSEHWHSFRPGLPTENLDHQYSGQLPRSEDYMSFEKRRGFPNGALFPGPRGEVHREWKSRDPCRFGSSVIAPMTCALATSHPLEGPGK